jgi:hypothetical protein
VAETIETAILEASSAAKVAKPLGNRVSRRTRAGTIGGALT